jgi:hypothetical protein
MSPPWERVLRENSGKSSYKISDEERQRRSDKAKELVKQGKIGGKEIGEKGGRPRKITASQLMAEAAVDHFEELKDAILSSLHSDNAFVQLQAAKLWFTIEQYSEKLDISHDELEIKKFTAIANVLLREIDKGKDKREELVEQTRQFLADNPELAEFFEGEFVEDDPGRTQGEIGASEGAS